MLCKSVDCRVMIMILLFCTMLIGFLYELFWSIQPFDIIRNDTNELFVSQHQQQKQLYSPSIASINASKKLLNNNNNSNSHIIDTMNDTNLGRLPLLSSEYNANLFYEGDITKYNNNNPKVIDKFYVKQQQKVAYAITVTKDSNFVDGALVLGYSAKKAHMYSKYAVDLIAFVAPTVTTSKQILIANGWIVLEKELPVALDEIENQEYAMKMKKSGCCGADEFLKLWAFTLIDYHRVVHLDMDSIIFQNMDINYV